MYLVELWTAILCTRIQECHESLLQCYSQEYGALLKLLWRDKAISWRSIRCFRLPSQSSPQYKSEVELRRRWPAFIGRAFLVQEWFYDIHVFHYYNVSEKYFQTQKLYAACKLASAWTDVVLKQLTIVRSSKGRRNWKQPQELRIDHVKFLHFILRIE